MLMILLMACAAFAGCLGSDDDKEEEEDDKPAWLDASDGGYTYASDVDNHRSLMNDLCEIKDAASSGGGYDFATAKDIYMNGKNAQKDDGSYRTLAGFASATGKNHDYDDYYGMNGSVDPHIMAGLDGIKNKIDPGEAATKDLYDLPPDELASIPTVCGSLREALNSLENDHEFLLQGDVFNVDQLEGYMDLKWEEVYAVEHTPHPVEYGLYYSL